MTTTIRMFFPKQCDTLEGYVFADLEHARLWLSQPIVEPSEIRLEEVVAGDLVRCRYCDGSGHRQSIKLVRKLTVGEFLKERADAHAH